MNPLASSSPSPSDGVAGHASARALIGICFALFAAATSMSCVFAILPAVGRELGLSELQIGWVVAPSALVFVLFGPVWGRLGQRWPARTLLPAALTMVAVFTLLFGFALAWRLQARISVSLCFALLVASRLVLSPFSAAMLPTAQAYIARTTQAAYRPRALAGMGASFSLGMVASPGLAAIASGAGLMAPFYVVAALLAVAALCNWAWLPRAPQGQPSAGRARTVGQTSRTAWGLIWQPLAILTLLYTIYGILMQVTGFRMQDQFHLDAQQATQHAGMALMAIAAAVVATQMALARLALPSLARQRRLVLAAGALGVLGLVLLLVDLPYRMQVLACALFGLSLGAFMPFILTMLTQRAQEAGDQSRIGGFSGAAQGLGMVIGPLLGVCSYRTAPQAAYGAALCCLLLAGGLYARASRA